MKILDCGHESAPSAYGMTADGKKHCYACCGEMDRKGMIETGKGMLYLTKMPWKEWQATCIMRFGTYATYMEGMCDRFTISNWPGSLTFRPHHVQRFTGWGFGGSYPIYSVYFTGPDGMTWYGRAAGRYSEILRCRRARQ